VIVHKTFAIKGMTCASCVAANERAVRKLPGVTNVSVNLATERMDVDFDSTSLDIAQIEAAVKKLATRQYCSKSPRVHHCRTMRHMDGGALQLLQYFQQLFSISQWEQ